jgi:methyltransferase (TIGR00027 family)
VKPHRYSATAYLIACGMVFVSRDEAVGHLVPLPAAEACGWFIEACSRRAPLLLSAMDLTRFRRAVRLIEKATIPGLFLHYALRKLAIEELARASLAEGFAQVVVLAAGFDTLAVRLHAEFPQVRFIEMDHPATQAVKEKVLREHDLVGPNLSLAPIDLGDGDLGDRLRAAPGFAANLRTLFVAEGILVYLSGAEVSLLFDALRHGVEADARFLFTVMGRRPDGSIGFRSSTPLADWWLRLKGEPFKWGLELRCLGSFLSERGFRPLSWVTHEELREKYLGAAPLRRIPSAAGETICLAEAVRESGQKTNGRFP